MSTLEKISIFEQLIWLICMNTSPPNTLASLHFNIYIHLAYSTDISNLLMCVLN